jgi:hypothetical protein
MKRIIAKRSNTPGPNFLSVCLSCVLSASPIATQLAPVRFSNKQEQEKAHSNKEVREKARSTKKTLTPFRVDDVAHFLCSGVWNTCERFDFLICWCVLLFTSTCQVRAFPRGCYLAFDT